MTRDTPSDPDDGRLPRRFARVGRVLPVALVQVVGTVAASRWAGGGPGPWARGVHPGDAAGLADRAADAVALGPVAIVLLVAGVVVLPFRWRWPTVVLAVVLVTTVAYAVTVSARGPFVAALTMALVNAWYRGRRVPVLVAAGVAAVALPWADVLNGRSPVLPWSTMLLAVAWLTATIALTEAVRIRHVRAAETRRARAADERRRADDERVRIARELHDSVAHNMSLINLQAGVALHLGDGLPAATRESLVHIRDASRDALVELRTVLGVLRSVDVAAERNPTPGLDRLGELVTRTRAAGIDVEVSVQGDVAAVSGVVDRSAYRIVQESLTNVMKHAPGRRVDVIVAVSDDTVTIDVSDLPSGVARAGALPGAVPSAASAVGATVGIASGSIGDVGNGIIGMRERATAVGGSFRAGPRADGSWHVHARLPIAPSVSSSEHTAPDSAAPASAPEEEPA